MDSLPNTGYFWFVVQLKNRLEANEAILYDNFAKEGGDYEQYVGRWSRKVAPD
jgi:hypothetical protein